MKNRNKVKYKMKRFLFALLLLGCLRQPAPAQIIILDSDTDPKRRQVEEGAPFLPELGVTYDQYAPLSEGVLLLCGLGGVYLLKKTKKHKAEKKTNQ